MMVTDSESAAAMAEFQAQGAIAPGTHGWWKVWGARPHDIRAGDLVLSMLDGELVGDLVSELFVAKAYPVRVGYVTDGERRTIGALVPIVLMRRGTKNTLAN